MIDFPEIPKLNYMDASTKKEITDYFVALNRAIEQEMNRIKRDTAEKIEALKKEVSA